MNDQNPLSKQALLTEILRQNRQGSPKGIYSVCSASPFVLDAAVKQAKQDGSFVLIESTSNQVNQFGGYTGLTPEQFRDYVNQIAEQNGYPAGQVILGGDHLGPNPWRSLPCDEAMAHALKLVGDCAAAGYVKIHLDASMTCADDPKDQPLQKAVSARRAAELCAAAEEAYWSARPYPDGPVYVIGTEVPVPGGSTDAEGEIHVTTQEEAQETIELTRDAFISLGLQSAWERVIALVVEPGVEFGHDQVLEYQPGKAAALKKFISGREGLVFEAHSTDYQLPGSLRSLINDHFAILKVGPGLTFAFREAVFAMEMIEKELLGEKPEADLSRLQETVLDVMMADPAEWERYYPEEGRRTALLYSYSDRVRYYWNRPELQQALSTLFDNLSGRQVPLSLLSQFMPRQYRQVRAGKITHSPHAWVQDQVRSVLEDYAWACGFSQGLPY